MKVEVRLQGTDTWQDANWGIFTKNHGIDHDALMVQEEDDEEYAVVRERIRDYRRYHILPADQYWQEREEGCWTHYSFETVNFFDSLEEAEDYVRQETDFFVLFYCLKEGFQGYDICHYTEAQNVYTQPSIFDIIFEGSLEECQERLKELEMDI